jgi:hypothetical protein
MFLHEASGHAQWRRGGEIVACDPRLARELVRDGDGTVVR